METALFVILPRLVATLLSLKLDLKAGGRFVKSLGLQYIFVQLKLNALFPRKFGGIYAVVARQSAII